jgi:glycerate kinase
MRILVAPDKFKGTLSAEEAARAISAGWLRERVDDTVEQVPMADGGEGTLEALVSALGGERKRARVTGPLGDPVDAEYGLVRAPEGLTGVVEMASASGLGLIPDANRDPRRTTTRGTGELILAALEHEPVRIVVCIGGSATNDGGAGMAQALGARLLNADGAQIRNGGEALLELARIDTSTLDPRAKSATFSVACDVNNPLVGPAGASAVYGPQKGASPEDVILLDRALGHYAALVRQDLGIDVRDTPGAGAAGGLGAGLIAFLGARLRPGIDVVMNAVGFEARLRAVDVVLTGEGSFDDQSLHGKTAMGVADAADQAGVPVAILCGRSEIERAGALVVALVDCFGIERAMGDTRAALEEMAADLAASWPGEV